MQTAEPVENAGALVVPGLSPDGSQVAVIIFSADALANDDTLVDLQRYVPAGQGIVLVLAYPPES